jgi:hypothetical protein
VRAQMTITDLDQDRWDYLQRNVRAEYEIPEGTTRVCLTFSREAEERHAEMPLTTLIGLLTGLILNSTFAAFTKVMDKINKTKTAEIGDPCEHGSPVKSTSPSMFDGAPPVRTHEDGCQSYGPYTKDPDFADRLENGAYEK